MRGLSLNWSGLVPTSIMVVLLWSWDSGGDGEGGGERGEHGAGEDITASPHYMSLLQCVLMLFVGLVKRQ